MKEHPGSFAVSGWDFERVKKGTIEDLEVVDVNYEPLGFFGRSTESPEPFSLLDEYHKALRALDKQFRNQKETKWGRIPAQKKENV